MAIHGKAHGQGDIYTHNLPNMGLVQSILKGVRVDARKIEVTAPDGSRAYIRTTDVRHGSPHLHPGYMEGIEPRKSGASSAHVLEVMTNVGSYLEGNQWVTKELPPHALGKILADNGVLTPDQMEVAQGQIETHGTSGFYDLALYAHRTGSLPPQPAVTMSGAPQQSDPQSVFMEVSQGIPRMQR